MIDNEVVR